MSKELEALEGIKKLLNNLYDKELLTDGDAYKLGEDVAYIETALQALEIIKDTLGIELRYCETTKTYGIEIGGLVAYTLKNKEEYDLLKEVLKDE